MHTTYPTDPTPVAAAAKRLGVSLDTLRRWIRSGQVRAWRLGPTIRGQKRRLVVSMTELLAGVVEPVIPTT